MDSGYPKSVIEDALERISRISRQQALQAKPNKTSEDRIPLTLTYHPLSMPIKRIIYQNFDILQTNKDTKAIFTKPPLMAFRRDSNLRDILVHSRLKRKEDNPGTYPCKHPRCRTCNHVSQPPTIQNLGNSFTVHKRYTCSSACLIYAIKCRKCGILYIGETCRQLNERFGEHIRNVEHKLHEDEKKKDQSDINVSQHFNSTGHSVKDMSILGLLDAPKDSRRRKTLEKRIIFKLDTRVPKGLNKQFSFLWFHLLLLLSILFSLVTFFRYLLDPTVLLNILFFPMFFASTNFLYYWRRARPDTFSYIILWR